MQAVTGQDFTSSFLSGSVIQKLLQNIIVAHSQREAMWRNGAFTGRRPTLIRQHFNTSLRRSFATKHTIGEGDEAAQDAARKWLAKLKPETIPRNICEVTFSRSSGPGGQNVNKVSSKATLRVPTSSLLPLIPRILHPSLLRSRYLAEKSSDIVIQADESRKQTDNVHACFRKLQDLIVEAGHEAVPGETSAEQLKRVANLQKAEAAGRRKLKEHQSKKKSARRGGSSDY